MQKDDVIYRQAAISAICNACGKIDCDKMDKCEKLQLPPANCSEFPNNSDLISRQAALEKVRAMQTYKLFVGDDMILVDKAEVQTELMMLPTAQTEVKEIGYAECANAMLKMWMDNVLTDGEYNRIMDRLNAHHNAGRRQDE